MRFYNMTKFRAIDSMRVFLVFSVAALAIFILPKIGYGEIYADLEPEAGSPTVLRDSYSYSLDYINEQDGLVVGDMVFDSFDVTTVSSGSGAKPSISNICVNAVQINGNYGLEFTGVWNSLAGQWVDSTLQFHAAILPSYISAGNAFDENSLFLKGYGISKSVKDGSVSISENIYNTYPGVADSIADEFVYYQSSSDKDVSDKASFSKVTDLWVVKDVFVYGGSGTSGMAHLSSFTQTFTQTTSPVPEPGTFALAGMGLLTLVGYAWRKRRA